MVKFKRATTMCKPKLSSMCKICAILCKHVDEHLLLNKNFQRTLPCLANLEPNSEKPIINSSNTF